MLIQKISQYNYNPNVSLQLQTQKSQTSIAFAGDPEEKADKFVNGFEQVQSAGQIEQYVKKSGISTVGRVKMTTLAGILKRFFYRIKKLEKEQKQLNKKISNVAWIKYDEENKIKQKTLSKYQIPDKTEIHTKFEDKLGIVAEILNKYSQVICGGDERTPNTVIKALENKNGHIHSDMLNFLEIILGGRNKSKQEQKKDINLVLKVINMVKDPNGNLDLEKAATFKAIYDISAATLLTTVDAMDEIYPSEETMTPEKLQQLKQKEKIQKEERKKVNALVKELNSYRTKDGKQIMEATIDEDGLINICMNIDAEFDFKPEKYGCDNNWAFEHIRSIDCVNLDLSNCKQLTSTGALELVQGCIAVKNREQQRKFDYFRNVVVSMIIFENTHYGRLK